MNDISGQGSFHKLYPELGNKPLAIDKVYTAEYFAEEKEKIFKKSWMRVGFSCELPNIGDYQTVELEVCDTSLIVTRGQDKKIRAFHNMCSHRSNRVAYEKKGNTKTFKCRFHAWTYGLDGALIHLPEPDLFPDFDQCDHGLTAVDCEVWEGFIFVNVNPENTQSLREYIGEEIWGGFEGYFEQFTRAV
ncbi:MAG: Rieske (2Fe-2S) protein, partial [Gammaproteobacteria bacterium]|nr:Rieske (2Fe-2S) protein [Gammaproteobacteria bacterium]